jgi:uroporphyrinogen decarboxylase
MERREVVRLALDHRRPPYVPWNIGLTQEARHKLREHFGQADVDAALGNHFLRLGSDIGFFTEIGPDRFQDVFGVIWDRSVDKDIGNPANCVLPQPTLRGYCFPNPLDARFFAGIRERIDRAPDRFRVFQIGFSLWERAWTLRGWQALMMDFHDHPAFVDELLNAIADYDLAQVRHALTYDIDAVYFGDDWGMQRGLQMGPAKWQRFIRPVLSRMVGAVRGAGKYVLIHSCGDVDELFDDLVEIGVSCFNPFQPEVMDVTSLIGRYRGRLAFHGGLSTQRTLPYGSPVDVRRETERLLALGAEGGYVFAPAHDVEGDVPLENMLAFIETVQGQQGYH